MITFVHKRLISLPLAIGALLLSAAATIPPAAAPFPSCPNLGYMFSSASGSQSTLSFYDISKASLVPIKDLVLGSNPIVVNAAGYSSTQNVFWGTHAVKNPPKPGEGPFPDEIVRVDSLGNTDSIGAPGNLAALGHSDYLALAGTAQGNRYYAHTKQPANHLFVIDIDPASATLGHILTDVTLSRISPGNPDAMLNIGDWDYNDSDGGLYGVELSGGKRKVVKVDSASGVVTDVADLSADLPNSDNYGAVFMEDGTANFYVGANNANMSGQSKTFMVRLDLTPPLVQPLGSAASLRINDGADCLLATDFGDAPDTYQTSSAAKGPAHVMTQVFDSSQRFHLGTLVDSDIDGFPSDTYDSDNTNVPSANDEDAVPAGTVLNSNAPKLTVPVTNNTGKAGLLAGWLDLDGDGTFSAAELATASAPANNGTATLSWPARKASLARQATPAALRLRLYADAEVTPDNTTWVDGGEIEDHLVALEPGATPPAAGAPPVVSPIVGDPPAGSAPGDPGTGVSGYAYDPDTGTWLPRTGSPVLPLVGLGVVVLGAGALLLRLSRRRLV
ncbi:GEVED domain-containing protein [Catelliglobosispora koreensis]|uniref:GEVED domain-containing protein n=1 Tax=Catelliglobosispora koreensis TaxID=129052 RepID=UPI000360B0D2|nr:GEVED domain-containing protein [Catelliglobosispora koreensis]